MIPIYYIYNYIYISFISYYTFIIPHEYSITIPFSLVFHGENLRVTALHVGNARRRKGGTHDALALGTVPRPAGDPPGMPVMVGKSRIFR